MRSLALFFVDSARETARDVRRHRGLARALVGYAAVAHAASFVLLAVILGPGRGLARAAVWVGASFVFLTPWLVQYVGLVRPRGGPVRRAFGTANHLTLARFFLIAPTAALFAAGRPGPALVLYAVLAATDVVDGVVARRRGEETEFGVVMDPLADVFSTAAVFAVFTARGVVPGWLFAILVTRYAMLILGSFALFLAVGPFEFRATPAGKVVGVVQAAGVGVIAVLAARGGGALDAAAPVLFPVLGAGFAAVIVSQFVIGIRHRRRAAAPAKG